MHEFLIDLFGLAGRTALLTGASSGIGREIAGALSRAGARVVLAGRDAERLRAAADDIGGTAAWVSADLADRAAIGELAEAVPDPDILVNAAAVNIRPPLARLATNSFSGISR